MTKNIPTVEVTYNATGVSFRSPQAPGVAFGTLGAVVLHADGTASHVGNGGKLDPYPCATWKVVA